MTYTELLTTTQRRKAAALKELNKALKGPTGFLVKAEIKNKPGAVAWHWLAKEFVETLVANIDTLMASEDSLTQKEMYDIMVAYEESSSDLYDLLPLEAQLFTA